MLMQTMQTASDITWALPTKGMMWAQAVLLQWMSCHMSPCVRVCVQKLGMTVDMTSRTMGVRTRRFAMYVDDGEVISFIHSFVCLVGLGWFTPCLVLGPGQAWAQSWSEGLWHAGLLACELTCMSYCF